VESAAETREPPYPVIRPPALLRAYVVVFGFIWCGGVVAGLVTALIHASPVAVFLLVMLAFGAGLCYRLFRMSVELRPGELLVRNYFRTIRVQVDNIEGFRVGSTAAQPLSKSIHVLLGGDQLIPLDVTSRPYLFGRGADLLDRRLAELKAWHAAH